MAAVELHVNATFYAQHPALKSVYGKDQSVIPGKLFFSNRTVYKHRQGFLKILKQVTLIASISL